MNNSKLSVAVIRGLISYNPDNGVLIWKTRTVRVDTVNNKRSDCMWNAKYAGKIAGSISTEGYTVVKVHKVGYKAARIAWALHHGSWPSGQIDHINGDRTDNRITNLRDVKESENHKNKGVRADNKSGVPGVTWNKQCKKWLARVRTGDLCFYLGLFDDISDAKKAIEDSRKENSFHPNHGKREARRETRWKRNGVRS